MHGMDGGRSVLAFWLVGVLAGSGWRAGGAGSQAVEPSPARNVHRLGVVLTGASVAAMPQCLYHRPGLSCMDSSASEVVAANVYGIWCA